MLKNNKIPKIKIPATNKFIELFVHNNNNHELKVTFKEGQIFESQLANGIRHHTILAETRTIYIPANSTFKVKLKAKTYENITEPEPAKPTPLTIDKNKHPTIDNFWNSYFNEN